MRKAKKAPAKATSSKDAELRARGEVVDRDLSLFTPNGWNPNELTAFERESLKHGLLTDGWLRSHALTIWGSDIAGTKKNIIIDGEHRWLVARELGFKKGPVVILEGITEREAREWTIKLDAKRGKFNDDKLSVAVRDLVDTDTNFDRLSLNLGIESERLQDLLVDDDPAKLQGEPVSDPEIPEAPRNAVTRAGDLIFLGKHRLYCGDSLKALDALLGGAQIDCVMTDPPYAIYGSSTGIGADVADDNMVRPFFEQMFAVMHTCVKENGHIYVCCDWRSWSPIWQAARSAKMAAKNCIVWDKMSPGLGSMYSMAHEFVGFFSRMPPPKGVRSSTSGGQRKVLRPNIMRYPRPQGDERKVNAAKPVDMFAELIGNSTVEGERVLDMFGGGGSTIIACEKIKRIGYACELNPLTCDIIVERWEAFTNQKATRRQATAA